MKFWFRTEAEFDFKTASKIGVCIGDTVHFEKEDHSVFVNIMNCKRDSEGNVLGSTIGWRPVDLCKADGRWYSGQIVQVPAAIYDSIFRYAAADLQD